MLHGEVEMLNGNGPLALGELASITIERRYEKGQILYMPGDPADTIFLLRAGRVQQYHLSYEGRKLVISILKPGDIFGATAVANGHGRHVFAEALDDCVVHVLGRDRVREVMLREPSATLLVIDELVRRLTRAEAKLEELIFEPVPVRLARWLIETAENGIVAGYTHQDISEILGTYRETATVALNGLKNRGYIDIERRRIKILDLAGLNRFVNGDTTTRPGNPAHARARPASERQPLAASGTHCDISHENLPA